MMKRLLLLLQAMLAAVHTSTVMNAPKVMKLSDLRSLIVQRDSTFQSKICATFGADSSSKLFQTVFDDISDEISGDLSIIETFETMDLYNIGAADVTVGLIGKVAAAIDADSLLARIQAFVDGVSRQTSKSRLFLVFDFTCDNALATKFMSKVSDMLNDAKCQSLVEVTMLDIAGENVGATRQAIHEALQQVTPSTASESRVAVLRKLILPERTRLPTATAESSDVLSFHAVVETLSSNICRDLAAVKVQKFESVASAKLCVAKARSIIEQAIENNYQAHAPIYDQHLQSSAMKTMAQSTRISVTQSLFQLYARVAAALHASAVEAFEMRIARVPGTVALAKNLKVVMDFTVGDLAASLAEVGDAFRHTAGLMTPHGLFSKLLATGSLSVLMHESEQSVITDGSRTNNTEPVKPTVVTTREEIVHVSTLFRLPYQIKQLQQLTRQRCDERRDTLFLQGEYNPYIRDKPYPPTHLNLNYLVEPNSFTIDREFDPLYDEHREGPCVDRADSLRFPGVAFIPFNPTENPISHDDVPWWQQIKDFLDIES